MAIAIAVAGCSEDLPTQAQEPLNAESAAAAVAPEGTDVWLLDLRWDGGALRADGPRNLTSRPGYDNQPYFNPAGELMFVQMENGKTDIWRWSPATQTFTQLTATPEQGEFSPTPIPESDGGVSYIRSPDDTSGRLWRMPQAGADPEIIFADIGPVGYHAWFDAGHVALWRLQDPSLLQLVDINTQEALTLATGVGRSPQSVPNCRAVSFTRATDEGTVLEQYDLDLERTEMLTMLPAGGDFHAWTPDGILLTTSGSKVYALLDGAWEEVIDLAYLGLTLSRLAISPDGSQLAVVAEPAD
jgi:hypothetical protein